MSDFGNKTVFAANLQWYMDKHKIDRNQLCADLGFKYSTVSAWLSAQIYPRIDKIETLARYFGVQKSALIEKDGSQDLCADNHAEEIVEESKRILQAIRNSGLSYMDLERITGISHSTLQRYAVGKTDRLPLSSIKNIAEALGVSAAWIVGWDDQPTRFTLTPHEGKVITAYRDKPVLQPAVDKLLDVEPESGRVIPLTAADRNVSPLRSPLKIGGRIPVLGKIPAGVPIKAVQDIIDEIDITPEMTRDGHFYFGLLVTGDSMIPEFQSGDYVIVRQQPTAENGDIVAAYVGEDNATLKRYHRSESGITLEALNPDYETRTFSPEEVDTLPLTIAGVVVEQRRNKQPAGHSPVTRVAAYDGSDDQPAFPTPDDLDTAPDLEF